MVCVMFQMLISSVKLTCNRRHRKTAKKACGHFDTVRDTCVIMVPVTLHKCLNFKPEFIVSS